MPPVFARLPTQARTLLMPQVRYVFKPHFGELPPYLRQRKKELEERREAEERARLQPEVGGAAAAGSRGGTAQQRRRDHASRGAWEARQSGVCHWLAAGWCRARGGSTTS